MIGPGHHYTCACCGNECVSDTPDEEAHSECKGMFGVDPANGGCDEVCDDCFQKMTRAYPPKDFRAEN